MLRSRLLPWFFTAGLFLVAACSDSVAPKQEATAGPMVSAPPSLVTLSGSVHVTGEDLYPVALTTSDGQTVRLTGESARILVSVDNAGVDVRGRWETDGADGFFVADFVVRAVDGNAVIDGTLIALDPAILDDGSPQYAIRRTDSGSYVLLSDPSPDLLAHLNERIWIAGLENGPAAPTAFGIIREM